ncbi:sterol desaturase family protein [Paenimyroides aestuarii]|uniref:Sterol desaturase family protein n=1 Tax=Paenimyroides aestuarii TaxID=2968490 RepID=A0ABY5NRM7_9FLAO|nr:sterol desaturase family protein [Paenimyroides aestuarii]UUV21139.1 sterol desaturase family protein [Paenimyroides aestuarii]
MSNFFGASPISYDDIKNLEAQSGDLIIYAIPLMAFFTGLEIWYSWYSKRNNYSTKESLGSLFVGLGNVVINLAFKVGFIYGAVYIYNTVPWRMEFNWWTLIPCLLIYDFCSYMAHRVSHFNRFFWATHVVHHSADHYNLTVSFRLSWVQHFKLLFFLPVAFLGFHPVIFFIVNQISVLFQFWQHTEYIGKLPRFFENIFVTPSNHRVHHGSDEKYIDKNFGAVFIFWDKLFGTYQPEEERPTYGITTKIDNKWNPLYLNFHEYESIASDVKDAKSLKEKFFYVFGSPGKIDKLKKKSVKVK